MRAGQGPALKPKGLSPKQERFVAEYLVDLNASAAARRAGYSERTARVVGPENLSKPAIAAAIEAERSKVATKLELSAERVLAEAWRILTADARELVEHRVGACRHCWGEGGRYQRTAAEMERDQAAHKAGRYPAEAKRSGAPALFDRRGGIGFDPRKPPNADCPECFGAGVGRTIVNDTRNLSPAAAALYAGIRQTRDGFEVKMHSKVDALDRLFRHLGLYDRLSLPADVVALLRADSGLSLADRGRQALAAAAAGDAPVPQVAQLIGGIAMLAQVVKTDELAAQVQALEEEAARMSQGKWSPRRIPTF